ncbi:MAG: cytochrome c3 family protein [Thermoanaerobaculia bacterium]
MRKCLALIAAGVLTATFAYAHHGPKTTTIDAAAKKQPGVVFAHEKHQQLVKSCDTCHHMNKGLTAEDKDAEAKVQKCATCHLDPKDAAPSMREMSMTKNPFHILCVNCHKEQKKGPTTCTTCHVKK